jgi:hypothetical protein
MHCCGTEHGLRVHSNGGFQDMHLIGNLPGLGSAWCNKRSLASILSLTAIRKICPVTTDTLEEADAVIVHKHEGDQMKFLESKSRLLCHCHTKATNKSKSADCTFVNTVSENKTLHTRRCFEGTDLGQGVQEPVGHPSRAMFATKIRKNQSQHCPIAIDDADCTVNICGPGIAAIRGKTTRSTPAHVPSDQLRPLPLDILETLKNVTLCFDIFFVNGFAFVGAVSRNIHFIMVKHIPSQNLLKQIKFNQTECSACESPSSSLAWQWSPEEQQSEARVQMRARISQSCRHCSSYLTIPQRSTSRRIKLLSKDNSTLDQRSSASVGRIKPTLHV